MKDGELVECGTHNELLLQNGEYAKMHQVQAQAFTAVSLNFVCFRNVLMVGDSERKYPRSALVVWGRSVRCFVGCISPAMLNTIGSAIHIIIQLGDGQSERGLEPCIAMRIAQSITHFVSVRVGAWVLDCAMPSRA
jgi:hypothetical protein